LTADVGLIRVVVRRFAPRNQRMESAAPLSRARSVRDNEEMSGGAKRSPLDLLVLPQPVEFYA
jgi:hypothetical protein